MNDLSGLLLRNIFRVAFLLSCHIFDCDGSCEGCVAVITERRKRDLNPRAGSPDLLPFQGSPFGQLGYFSVQIPTKVSLYLIIRIRFQRVPFRLNSSFSLNMFPDPKRRGWDSNPCAREDKRFSRPPRYDHFATSPNGGAAPFKVLARARFSRANK